MLASASRIDTPEMHSSSDRKCLEMRHTHFENVLEVYFQIHWSNAMEVSLQMLTDFALVCNMVVYVCVCVTWWCMCVCV